MAIEDKERMVERLRDIVATTSVLLCQKAGDLGGEVMDVIGGTLRAP